MNFQCNKEARLVFKLIFSIFIFYSSVASGCKFEQALEKAAIERTKHSIKYDGSYYSISYPNGDVPADIGVCTDVVIRAYRALRVDLQKLLHEDILARFNEYPSKRIWGLNKPDKNIDHRRVPNLQVFFLRHGKELSITNKPSDYKPGDLVTWMLNGRLPHIGIVTSKKNEISGVPLVVHNIGQGPKLEDILFVYDISGHYRYVPTEYQSRQ